SRIRLTTTIVIFLGTGRSNAQTDSRRTREVVLPFALFRTAIGGVLIAARRYALRRGAEAGMVFGGCAELAVPFDLAADAFVGIRGAVDDFLRCHDGFGRVGGDLACQPHRPPL